MSEDEKQVIRSLLKVSDFSKALLRLSLHTNCQKWSGLHSYWKQYENELLLKGQKYSKEKAVQERED
jgi:hypothetical protein